MTEMELDEELDETFGLVAEETRLEILRAAVSGVYTDRDTELDSFVVGDCSQIDCDGTISASYAGGRATMDCDRCDMETTIAAPPIVVGARDLVENPEVLGRHALTVIQKTIRGFCHLCSGPIQRRVDRDPPPSRDGEHVSVVYECRACGSTSYSSAVTVLIDDPTVIATLHEAGIDYREALFRDQGSAFDLEESIVAEEPLEVEVTITPSRRTRSRRTPSPSIDRPAPGRRR